MDKVLYLMMGYPGAGKTTTSEIISRLTGAVHLASDKIRLSKYPEPKFTPEEHAELYNFIDAETVRLLNEGHSVIYDANLNRFIHRQQKYDIGRATDAKPVLVWVQIDKDLARQRATEGAENDSERPYGNLDSQTFDRLVSEIEPPQDNEAYIAIDGTKISPDYVRSVLQAADAL